MKEEEFHEFGDELIHSLDEGYNLTGKSINLLKDITRSLAFFAILIPLSIIGTILFDKDDDNYPNSSTLPE